MKWVTSTTVVPSCRISRTSSHVARRAWGSSPWVSSSRKTTSGEFYERQRDEQALALTAREGVESLSAQVVQSPAGQELVAVDGMVSESGEQFYGLAYL
jgi:hypothetical protein